jgi:recombination protein RecA
MDATPLSRRWRHAPGISPSRDFRWIFPHVAGRLVEISGTGDTAVLTFACALIRDAQSRSEPSAWIAAGGSTFFPPDAAACGVDLDALILIRARDTESAASAAERVLRSSAFGLIIIDLGKDWSVPLPALARLSGLARRHHTAVLFLTERSGIGPSLGPLISLAASTRREKIARDRFRCALDITKDKHGAPASGTSEDCSGPSGMR